MINQALFSSLRDNWETPKWLFDKCDSIWHFTLDAASNDQNALCDKHYTELDDGLSKDWGGGNVFGVILHMAEVLASGCKRLMRKAESQIQS